MPFILRDTNGKIYRASARHMHGAEVVPHNNPDLIEFIKERGLDYAVIENAVSELKRTDGDMSRAIEDVIMALLKKNVLKMSDLPNAVQDRMSLRVKLRVSLQEIYDKASGQATNILANMQMGALETDA